MHVNYCYPKEAFSLFAQINSDWSWSQYKKSLLPSYWKCSAQACSVLSWGHEGCGPHLSGQAFRSHCLNSISAPNTVRTQASQFLSKFPSLPFHGWIAHSFLSVK